MIIGDLVDSGSKLLSKAGINQPQSEVELIIAKVLNEDKSYVIAHIDKRLSKSQLVRINSLLNKRSRRLPMSYVLGEKDFYGRLFKIDNRALTPRVETENIVEQVINRAPQNASVIDVGTGCGAIAISIKLTRPDLIVSACDVSQAALDLAAENRLTFGLSESDLCLFTSDIWSNVNSSYDFIVANLPYVKTTADLMPEVSSEPAVALFGGQDGLDLYRRFFKELPDHLNSAGVVLIESDPWQQLELDKLSRQANLKPIYHDYFISGYGQ